MIKRLTILIIVLAIALIPLGVLYSMTTNTTVTNEMAIDQLNGGDEEYVEAQVYNNYRHFLASAIGVVSATIIALIATVAVEAFYNSKK